MAAIEPRSGLLRARTLDPLVGGGRLRLHPRPGRRDAHAHHRHAARHPRGGPGGDPRPHRRGPAPRGRASCPSHVAGQSLGPLGRRFAEYIDWRAEHPSDDLMTELLTRSSRTTTGTIRTLTREEILGYVGLLAGAGNETTTRLIGWAGKLLAEHPDQRRELAEDPRADSRRHRGAPALRAALAGPGAVRHQDVEHHGQTVPAGSVHGAPERRRPTGTSARSPIRTASTSTGRSTSATSASATASTSAWAAHLARLEGRIALEEVLQAVPRLGGRLGQRRPGPHLDGAGMGAPARLGALSDGSRRRPCAGWGEEFPLSVVEPVRIVSALPALSRNVAIC